MRITESDVVVESTSPSLTRFNQLFLEAFYQAGHLFDIERRGLASELTHLLTQIGLKNPQTLTYELEYRTDTPTGEQFCEDVKIGMETLAPFIRRWSRLPADYDELREQINQEMLQPDFSARVHVVTAWGMC